MRARPSGLILGLFQLSISRASAALPYNPTSVYLTQSNGSDILLAFVPSTAASSSIQLQTLNVSSQVDTSAVSWKTASNQPPFISGNDSITYAPAVDDSGDLTVFAGDCSAGASPPALWRYVVKGRVADEGTWEQQSFTPASSTMQSSPYFLSAAISFSSSLSPTEEATFYSFGGMCPDAVASQSAWVSDAEYSNSLLAFAPTSNNRSTYHLDAVSSRSPPIAEAGFTITPLAPTFSNATDGSQTRQQNFVLFGGHTQTAFINTSQVGLFSLPEQTWTFVPVDSPSGSKSDLTRRDTPEVEPRSGHTTVLTPDGKNLIVCGGWVGDIGTPADPQLAVLKLGEGYGGAGDWTWSRPGQTGTGLGNGQGIYGHGAVMLPGGVMMIVGGYDIPASTSNRVKRSDPVRSTKTFFYNTTSNTWMSSYANPSSPNVAQNSSPPAPNSSRPSSPNKAAIGAGVALGLVALAAAAAVAFGWYSKRLQNRREVREQDLRSLAIGAARNSASGWDGLLGNAREQGPGDWKEENAEKERKSTSYPWTPGPSGGSFGEGPGWREGGGTEAERTGLLVEIPSPTRGLRKSLHARPRSADRILSYPYEEQRRSGISGIIHPIDEREEYEDMTESINQPDLTERDIVSHAPILDPFGDPNPLSSHPVSEGKPLASSARERDLEIREWVSDWAVADAALHGRNSPEKDRTSSTLSEGSVHSIASALSTNHPPASTGTLSRTVSQSSAAFLSSINPFEPPFAQRSSSPVRGNGARTYSPTSSSQRPESGGSASFTTAHTSLHALQTDGEALLPRPNIGTPPDSPTKFKSRASSLLGSMRRAFPLLGSHSSDSDRGSRSPSPTSYRSGGSGSLSPSKQDHEIEMLREPNESQRAASVASTAVWRQRKGAGDWDENPSLRNGDEWDVEAAVERRVVQVMFTVPREKLRVVNAGEDETSEVVSIGDVRDDQDDRDDANDEVESVVSTVPEMVREIKGKQRMIVD
jgi:hypothetical protein